MLAQRSWGNGHNPSRMESFHSKTTMEGNFEIPYLKTFLEFVLNIHQQYKIHSQFFLKALFVMVKDGRQLVCSDRGQ